MFCYISTLSTLNGIQWISVDKVLVGLNFKYLGKLVERQGRKAMGLRTLSMTAKPPF